MRPTERPVLVVDPESCYGCLACVVACKQENLLPPGEAWVSIARAVPARRNGTLEGAIRPIVCRHCSKPPCRDACPAGAIVQDSQGRVLVLDEECIGCLECIDACPWRAIGQRSSAATVSKCTLCAPRVDRGLQPACVAHCPTGALAFEGANCTPRRREDSMAQRRQSKRFPPTAAAFTSRPLGGTHATSLFYTLSDQ